VYFGNGQTDKTLVPYRDRVERREEEEGGSCCYKVGERRRRRRRRKSNEFPEINLEDIWPRGHEQRFHSKNLSFNAVEFSMG
jgi:hypothetical protein